MNWINCTLLCELKMQYKHKSHRNINREFKLRIQKSPITTLYSCFKQLLKALSADILKSIFIRVFYRLGFIALQRILQIYAFFRYIRNIHSCNVFNWTSKVLRNRTPFLWEFKWFFISIINCSTLHSSAKFNYSQLFQYRRLL